MSDSSDEDVAMSDSSDEDVEIYDNNDGNVDKDWEAWKKKYQKSYSSSEEEHSRKQAWLRTRVRVTEHNRRYLAGEETYQQGANMFSDLLEGESPCGCCSIKK